MTSIRWLLLPVLTTVGIGLSLAILSLPESPPGLQNTVAQHLEFSGVTNPVTAVLLNFRAYDTLLELAVLLLAVLGVWSLDVSVKPDDREPGLVLEGLTRLLLPLLILVAAYLLWIGSYGPGGAFQAGAVLSAAGILLVLAGRRTPVDFYQPLLRLILVSGVSVFTAVGLSALLTARPFLQYPTEYAGGLILLIEGAATLAIGLTLTLLFIGTIYSGRRSP